VIRRTVLPGGLRVVTEVMPGVRSVAFGVWVGVGSRDEIPSLAGASHYLEHLLFKGTARRDALEIAAALDAVGGETNAFTDKEYTCYYARVLDADLPLAIDVISDMVTSSTVAAPDVDNERGVILEEIAQRDDDPGDAVHDLFASTVLGDTPLGRPIIGTVASIEALTRTQIAGYYRRRYRPSAMVVAAAGKLDHAAVVRQVRRAFAPLLADADPADAPAARRAAGRYPVQRAGREEVASPGEQVHLVLGGPALSRTDERRFALAVLNNALGGGMSSRLFQEVRERRGLAYSVYSFASSYADTGLVGLYAGCAPSKLDAVLDLCREIVATVAADGVSDEEVARGQGQLKGALVLGMEDTGSRMSRLGKGELVYGDVLTVDELLALVDAVTPEDVRAVAADVLAGPLSLSVVGPPAKAGTRSASRGGLRAAAARRGP